jgi:hypothetical protein
VLEIAFGADDARPATNDNHIGHIAARRMLCRLHASQMVAWRPAVVQE